MKSKNSHSHARPPRHPIEVTDAREAGIRAIIKLQKVVGIVEPRWKAEEAWDSFTEDQKSQTLFAAHALRMSLYD